MPNAPESLPRAVKVRMGRSYQNGEKRRANAILRGVARYWGVTEDDLVGRSRKIEFVWPRQVAMLLMRENTCLLLGEIGRIFGRHHTDVLHNINRTMELLSVYPRLNVELEAAKKKLHFST